jgi:ABC-type transport system substrate-binding protein
MADPLIREGVDRCVDKPGIVEAATDGIATPAWSFVAPGTWAAAADLPELPRDVSYARSKIEQAGWTMAADGYYQKGAQRLGIEVLVGGNRVQRIRFLELATLQLRDCGFGLTVQVEDPRDINVALSSWPQTLPDGHQFQAVMYSSFGLPDPGLMCDFDSTQVVTAASQDNGCNAGAYANASVDRDLAAGRDTYDFAARAEYYKDMQAGVASDHAALFAWFNTEYDVLAPGIAATRGPIDLTDPGWAWELEALVKANP